MTEKYHLQRWGDKRYNSLNRHLREKFGGKVFKIPLDAGFTCPNRDGTLSREGCYFCSARGSGDFAGSRQQNLEEQFSNVCTMMHRKWAVGRYIAYFQAYSNTYAPLEKLQTVYEYAIARPGVVGLAIATRPDCLPVYVLDYLEALNRRIYLWVELGLQTIHESTARRLNLQYNFKDFSMALEALQSRGIETCAHIILGLPGEQRREMLLTGQTVARLPLQGLKIHLLHLMKGTPLEKVYRKKPFRFLEKDEYVELVADILEMLPPQVVIHRLTGDSPRELLIGPDWSLFKWEVLNSIDRCLEARDTWQGRLY